MQLLAMVIRARHVSRINVLPENYQSKFRKFTHWTISNRQCKKDNDRAVPAITLLTLKASVSCLVDSLCWIGGQPVDHTQIGRSTWA
jgi:hypothetical protein